jgi:inner membrane protein
MTGSTHVVIAVAATLAYSVSTGQTPDLSGWMALIIGSLAPDIDSGGATIARPGSLIGGGYLFPRWLTRLLDQIGLTLSRLIRSLLGHRNVTHWPVWAIALMLLGHHLGLIWLGWFGFGYLWHILADFCTKSGVPVAGPFCTKAIKWSPLKTGTWAESVLATALWGFIMWQGWELFAGSTGTWLGHVADNLLAVIS